jgi:hypothetical protein
MRHLLNFSCDSLGLFDETESNFAAVISEIPLKDVGAGWSRARWIFFSATTACSFTTDRHAPR